MTVPPIPVFRPFTDISTVKHVVDALEVGWLGMGRLTQEFEAGIDQFLELNDRSAVTTNTGTSALHLGLRVAGVGPGDEVITTSFNYVADHQAIRMCGAEPVFADIEEATLGLDPAVADALVGPRTKAILPLHFAGIPCRIDEILEWAASRSLRVVEDACHAFGTRSQSRRIGSFGDITCFSFDPVKVVTSLDGGAVISPDGEVIDNLRRMRFLGVDRETHLRYQNSRAWEYDVLSEGYRYHLNSVSAAVGLSQLAQVEDFIASRIAVCRQYNEAFAPLDWCTVPNTDFSDISPFIYTLRVKNGRRDALIGHLRDGGVDAGIHFIPVHRHTHFRGARAGPLMVTDKVCGEVVTLPLHSRMEPSAVERVVEGVSTFAG